MGKTRTAARTDRPVVARAGAVVAALVVLGLTGCGQGTGQGTGPGAAPVGPTTPTTTPSTAGGDGMGSTAPGPDGTATSGVTTAPPGAAALPSDPAGADLVLVAGPPGAQQPPVTLVCDWAGGTAGGTHPQAAQACTDLLAAVQTGNPFDPVAPDVMCTQQYGGDAVVEVSGAVVAADGAPVDVAATFTLTDGCQISRFDAMGAVLAPFRSSV